MLVIKSALLFKRLKKLSKSACASCSDYVHQIKGQERFKDSKNLLPMLLIA